MSKCWPTDPLVWQPSTDPPVVQSYFDIFSIPSHQRLGNPPSNRVDLDDANMELGAHFELPIKQQRIHMTPPQGPHLVCPPFLLVDVERTSVVPTISLVVTNNRGCDTSFFPFSENGDVARSP